jgi:hypothetical protein
VVVVIDLEKVMVAEGMDVEEHFPNSFNQWLIVHGTETFQGHKISKTTKRVFALIFSRARK